MLNLVVRKVPGKIQKVKILRRFEKRSAMIFKGATNNPWRSRRYVPSKRLDALNYSLQCVTSQKTRIVSITLWGHQIGETCAVAGAPRPVRPRMPTD